MKQKSLFTRYHLLLALIFCYLLPILGMGAYGALIPREIGDWNIFSVGLLLSAFGSLIFFCMMLHWEKKLKLNLVDVNHQFPKNESTAIAVEDYNLIKRSLEEAQQTQVRLLSEIETLMEEIQGLTLEKNKTHKQNEILQEELELAKRRARREMEQQQNHIRQLQENLADQKSLNEKKQHQMMHLESKVGDLTYEIKTLLKFAEAHTSSTVNNENFESEMTPSDVIPPDPYPQHHNEVDNPVQSAQEASQQLKKCLEISQKIKGSQRFGSQIYTFLDSPADHFSLDLRRLCDRLRGEFQSVILLYAPKDNHLLFASNQIKTLTGWSPDKFAQNFFDILLNANEWKEGINHLSMLSEAQIKIQLRSRSGSTLTAAGVLGMIPTGIFRNHVIAILYTSHF